MRMAVSKNCSIGTSVNPEALPVVNEGMKVRGSPGPKMLQPTPITVAVLNIVLMPALE